MTTRAIIGACAVAAALAVPASAAAALRYLQTPTGNIACMIEDGKSVRCDIRERDWSPPRRPASCEFDYGQGVFVNATGRARFVCAGDTVLSAPGDPYPVLRYGRTLRVGAITCVSRQSGLTCRNRPGRGFTMSRQAVRFF